MAAGARQAPETHGCRCSTVNTLGVLTGNLLLGMTKEEIRTVCPEEGSKVFFQLQTVKSAVAVSPVARTHALHGVADIPSCPLQLASEQGGMLGRRY